MQLLRLVRHVLVNGYLLVVAANIATLAGITATAPFWIFNIAALATYHTLNYVFNTDVLFSRVSLLRLPFYMVTSYVIGWVAPALGISAAAINLLKFTSPFVFEFARTGLTLAFYTIANLFGQQAPGIDNDVRAALIVRDNNRAIRALRRINSPEVLMHLGLTTIVTPNHEVFRAIVDRLHTIAPQEVARQNNRLLRAASHHQRVEHVNTLLGKRAVKDNAGANNNEALREACLNGNVQIVQRLLEHRNVNQNLTFNHNEAVRIAEREGRFAVVELLLANRRVADYVAPARTELTFTARNTNDYYPAGGAPGAGAQPQGVDLNRPGFIPGANIPLFDFLNGLGINPPQDGPQPRHVDNEDEDQDNNLRFAAQGEGAMRGNNERQRTALNEMEQRYRVEFNRKGRENIFNEIRQYFTAQYEQNPARYMGQALPRERGLFNLVADNTPYYQHRVHTAYRYLFLRPNPWISPLAGFTVPVNGGHAASISERDLNMIAYMWLAATDNNQQLPEGYSREALLTEFTEAIAELGRAHNCDHGPDDMQGDKPTCGMGVNQRVTQFYMVFLNERPETRPITADIISQKFKQEMINESAVAGNLFNKLREQNRDTLNQLEQALDDLYVINLGDRDAIEQEQRDLLDQFIFSQEEVDGFVEICKNYFGANRITRRNEQRVAFQEHRFNNFEEMIRHLAADALRQYYDDIKRNITQLKNEEPKNKKGDKAKKGKKSMGKANEFTPNANAKKRKTRNQRQDSDQENVDKNVREDRPRDKQDAKGRKKRSARA